MSGIFHNLREYQKVQHIIREGNVQITPPLTEEEKKRIRREERMDKVKEVCQMIIGWAFIILLFSSPFIFSEEDVLPFAIGGFVIFILIPFLVALIFIAVSFVKAYTKVKWKIVLGSIILFALMIGAIAVYSNVREKWGNDKKYEYLDSQRPDKM